MANITIKEQVHVDLRIDGITISEDFAPGDVEVLEPVADLLVSQGLADYSLVIADAPFKASDDSTTSKKKTTKTASTESPEA